MKKFLNLISTIIVVGICCGCYGSRDPVKPYPWYRADCWYCEEIDMTIRFSVDKHGNIAGSTNSQLISGDMMIDVGIGFQHDSVGFLSDLDGDGMAERILDGTWIYRGENMVIQIQEDAIFSGEYTELIFVPSEQQAA